MRTTPGIGELVHATPPKLLSPRPDAAISPLSSRSVHRTNLEARR
jgi:hypothetical protein